MQLLPPARGRPAAPGAPCRRVEHGHQAHGALRRSALQRGAKGNSRHAGDALEEDPRQSLAGAGWHALECLPGHCNDSGNTHWRQHVSNARPAAAYQRHGVRGGQPAGPGLRSGPCHRQIHRLQDSATAGRPAWRTAGGPLARLPQARDLPGHPLAGRVTQRRPYLYHALVPAAPDRVRPPNQGLQLPRDGQRVLPAHRAFRRQGPRVVHPGAEQPGRHVRPCSEQVHPLRFAVSQPDGTHHGQAHAVHLQAARMGDSDSQLRQGRPRFHWRAASLRH